MKRWRRAIDRAHQLQRFSRQDLTAKHRAATRRMPPVIESDVRFEYFRTAAFTLRLTFERQHDEAKDTSIG
jgi:hypothetical protein